MKISISIAAKAKALGFDTSKVWYHGTNKDFDEFDPHAKGDFSSDDTGGLIFLTDERRLAADYADQGALITIHGNKAKVKEIKEQIRELQDKNSHLSRGNPDQASDYKKYINELIKLNSKLDRYKGGQVGKGANVMPVYIRGKYKHVNMDGAYFDAHTNITVSRAAKREGYDGVIMQNYIDDTSYRGLHPIAQDLCIVFDPKNIRSIFAKFEDGESSKLLASN